MKKKFYPGLRERLEAGKLAKKQQAEKEEAPESPQPTTSKKSLEDQIDLKDEENVNTNDVSAKNKPKEEEIETKKKINSSKALAKTEKLDSKKKFASLENTEAEVQSTRSSKRFKKK
jgi:hypothetical protein